MGMNHIPRRFFWVLFCRVRSVWTKPGLPWQKMATAESATMSGVSLGWRAADMRYLCTRSLSNRWNSQWLPFHQNTSVDIYCCWRTAEIEPPTTYWPTQSHTSRPSSDEATGGSWWNYIVPQWPNFANFQREGWPKPSLEGEDGIMSWWSTGRVKGSQPTTGLHRITTFEDLLSVFPRPWSMMKYVSDLPRESWLITARKLFSLCDQQHALATFLGHIDCAWFQLPTSSRK